MRRNKLRELINAGEPTLGTHLHTTWPSMVEVVGHTGLFDYIEFSGEYAPFDLYALDNFCRAAELYDLGTLIKVDQEPRTWLSQRAIGAGFQAVLFADCRNADDVRACVRMCRAETPEEGGTYGVAMRRFAYMRYGGTQDYVNALRDVVVTFMIEKGSALDQLEEILSVEGVDMVQWGPADYAMSIGHPGERNHPDVVAAGERVFKTALRMGVIPRAELSSADDAKRFLDMGVRHFCVGTDIMVMHQYLTENGEAMRRALSGE